MLPLICPSNLEIISSNAEPSRSTDIYAFGVIAWELLTGKPFITIPNHPFQGPCDISVLPQPLASISPMLSSLIQSAANFDRNFRRTMREHSQDLNAYYLRRYYQRYDIFFSHCWEAKPFLTHVYHYLTASNYFVWYDVSSMPHQIFPGIEEGIQNSRVTIACLSRKYFHSEFCLFELRCAHNAGKPIIFILLEKREDILKEIEELPVDNEFKDLCQKVVELKNLLFIDLSNNYLGVRNWNEINEREDRDPEKLRQVKAIEEALKDPLVRLLYEYQVKPVPIDRSTITIH